MKDLNDAKTEAIIIIIIIIIIIKLCKIPY